MKTKRSLMTRYCLGGDLEFEGIPCEHILEPSRECELLKTSTIGVFFSSEKRCLSWRILLDMVRKRLRAYKKTYRYLDAIDDLNIGGLISRLAGSRVKGPPNIFSLVASSKWPFTEPSDGDWISFSCCRPDGNVGLAGTCRYPSHVCVKLNKYRTLSGIKIQWLLRPRRR